MKTTEYFVRDFDIDVLNTTLQLSQKSEGDVGCVVWDAAIVLAKYLEKLFEKNRETFENLNVIELGAGVGCVGLTAACLGANVLLTDLEETLPLLEKNIKNNEEQLKKTNGKAQVTTLQWGEPLTYLGGPNTPDLVLLADCIYYKDSIDNLIKTLRDLAGRNTVFLLSQELRESEIQKECWKYFKDQIMKHFKIRFVPLVEQDETFSSEDIVLIEFKRL